MGMFLGAPFSPIERLRRTPDPPRSICRARVAPIVKRPSPGCAAIAMILPGMFSPMRLSTYFSLAVSYAQFIISRYQYIIILFAVGVVKEKRMRAIAKRAVDGSFLRAIALAVLLAAVSPPSRAQTTSGSVTGTVHDSSGAV